MNQDQMLDITRRVAIVVVGFLFFYALLYAAGKLLVPVTDGMDKAILAAINPDSYAPGFDELFRAINDYTNPVILLPMLSMLVFMGFYRRYFTAKHVLIILLVAGMVAGFMALEEKAKPALFLKIMGGLCAAGAVLFALDHALHWLSGGQKRLYAGLFVAEAAIILALIAMGRLWHNKEYVGANVLDAVMFLAAFGITIWAFTAMSNDAMRRISLVFGLMALSGLLTDFGITQPIKGIIARPRPLNDANKPWNESVRIIPEEVLRGNNSFPSGHTSGTFALLTPLFWHSRNRKVRIGLMTWATLQGVGRIYTAAHFPFCVLMGGILGFGMGTLIFFVLGGPSLWPKEDPVSIA